MASSRGRTCSIRSPPRKPVDHDAALITQRIALAEADVRDLDGRIARLDAMVTAATKRGYTRSAMRLADHQAKDRAELVAEREQAAERLADLKVQQADVEAERARVTAEAGPALYLAKLFGWDDTEAVVRLSTALLVLVLDPLAVLTLGATRFVCSDTDPPALSASYASRADLSRQGRW